MIKFCKFSNSEIALSLIKIKMQLQFIAVYTRRRTKLRNRFIWILYKSLSCLTFSTPYNLKLKDTCMDAKLFLLNMQQPYKFAYCLLTQDNYLFTFNGRDEVVRTPDFSLPKREPYHLATSRYLLEFYNNSHFSAVKDLLTDVLYGRPNFLHHFLTVLSDTSNFFPISIKEILFINISFKVCFVIL